MPPPGNATRCGSREIGKMLPSSPLSMNESTRNAAPWKCGPVRAAPAAPPHATPLGVQVSASETEFCSGCALGKTHRVPFHSRPPQSSAVGELVHADVCGPMSVASVGKARYFVCFKDDHSKFRRIFFIKQKSEVHECMEIFINEAKTNGHVIKRMRTDGGGEFLCAEVAKLLIRHGIERITCPPYTPQLNGSIERENRSVVESARSMMCSTDLPKSLWAESCNTAVYLLNLSGKSSVEGQSPSELWYSQRVLEVNHLKIFGTECFVFIPDGQRSKFDAKSRKGVVVGYVNGYDGYRVWVQELKKIVTTRHLRFLPERVCSQKEVGANTDKMKAKLRQKINSKVNQRVEL